MGSAFLWRCLRGLCDDSQWNYAVFWKLRCENEMILTWEDGYCDYPKPTRPVENVSGDTSGGWLKTLMDNYFLWEFPIEQLVADMSGLRYSLGHGIVGEVAYSGNYCWVSGDDIIAGDVSSKLVKECPNEWLLQFTSGIKTIVLVPVLPHGVLQLGSFEVVPEDLTVVASIKNIFALHYTSDVDSEVLNIMMASVEEEVKSVLHVPEAYCVRNNYQVTCGSAWEESIGVLSFGEEFSPPPSIDNQAEDQFQIWSNEYGDCVQGEFSGTSATAHIDLGEELFGHKDMRDATDNMDSLLKFAKDSEFRKAVWPVLCSGTSDNLSDSSNSVERACNNSSITSNRNLFDGVEPFFAAQENDAGYLLEAVVGCLHHGSDDRSSNGSNGVSQTWSRGLCPPSQSRSLLVGQSTAQRNDIASSSNPPHKFNCIASAPFESFAGTVIPEDHVKINRLPKRRRGLSNISKKKLKLCNSQKPRPRDRQLIQDRIKELRGLIPEGEKCSIDGLLDQTIKHMQHLRSATKRAAQLKKLALQEAFTQTNLPKVDSSDKSGMSWGLESERSCSFYPIFVKDLSQPGQMLIEILCNTPRLFLETAQVIRGLDLTIIKGSMEKHENNTWARFFVEVKTGFKRLDLFWPLTQLWQRQRNSFSSKI